MTGITIPAAVVEAVAVAEWDAERARIGDFTLPPFAELHPEVKKLKLENAHVACLAMIEAWPDRWDVQDEGLINIILPVPQEASDE